jgi:excinuclease ABC subunit B
MAEHQFQVVSEFQPTGDQPQAIEALVDGIAASAKYQTLMGVTGSGKTFTMANMIARVHKPTLVISHNKTLAAQLYEEFRELFPDNAVNYFVSYYDYYQPEAYIPQRDIYIEKDASRNDDLDRLRMAATSNLVTRRDVIVVASVSCIFGLGSPDEYKNSVISLSVGQQLPRQVFLRTVNELQYQRNDFDFKRGTYRVRGDVVELHDAGEEFAYRIEWFGDVIESLQMINPVSGELLAEDKQIFIFPAVHYVMPEQQLQTAIDSIKEELEMQVMKFKSEAKLMEAHRLAARTKYDLEMIQEVGYCSGIENYSRHLDGRPAGTKPYTLMDYFPTDDWLFIIDESHVTLPQMRAMFNGDQARKKVLVEHGFRLPSAMDNRPMRFEEIEKLWPHVVFVSATPGPYELEKCSGAIVEQLIRPTGLVDPEIVLKPAGNQVPDLMLVARQRAADGERTLVTTLTKRLAEDLSSYLSDQGIKCRYLHSDIETLDRIEILRELREGKYDVLVGVNLLREGATSLIQQIGRAARNVNATVILYADKVTPAMQQALDETNRRRDAQLEHNKEHGITPRTVKKAIRRGIELELRARKTARDAITADETEYDRTETLADMEKQMLKAAESLEFERAASLRDQIKMIRNSPLDGKVDKSRSGKTKPGTPGKKTNKRRKYKSSY